MEFIKRNYVLVAILLAVLVLAGIVTVHALNQLDVLVKNTTTQKDLTARALANSDKQLKIVEEQLQISKQQLDISKQTLDAAAENRNISRELLREIKTQHAILEQSYNVQLQVLGVAQQVLQETKVLNQKTPDTLRVIP